MAPFLLYLDPCVSTATGQWPWAYHWYMPSARPAAAAPAPLAGLKLARAHLAALKPAVASGSLAPRPPLAARHAAPRRAGTATTREHRLRAGSRRRAR